MIPTTSQETRYEIWVGAQLDRHWERLAEHLRLYCADDHTVLLGSFPDQAALYGLLSRLRDLGVPLLLVRRLDEH